MLSWRQESRNRGAARRRDDIVLVVEDDPAIRESLCEAIRAEGFRVEAAVNGLEALEKLRWGVRPCLILLDLQMRLMTGWEFREQQRNDAALAHIPVVAMTAGRWKESDQTDYASRVEKPIHLDTLHALLQRYCERHDAHAPIPEDAAGAE